MPFASIMETLLYEARAEVEEIVNGLNLTLRVVDLKSVEQSSADCC
jgi:hypothetical protein